MMTPEEDSAPLMGIGARGEKKVLSKAQAACRLLFLENPDGSLMCGIQSGQKIPTAPSTPQVVQFTDGGAILESDLEMLFQGHEHIFLALLVGEFIFEFWLLFAYAYYAPDTVHQVGNYYSPLSLETLWAMFVMMYSIQVMYLGSYYGIGLYAIYENKASAYSMFARVAIVGILGQLFLAYMNKFNLVAMLLRLAAFVYARLVKSLLQTMAVIPMMDLVDIM